MVSVLVLFPDPDNRASLEAISHGCAYAIFKAMTASPCVSACRKVTVGCLTQRLPYADVLIIGGGESRAMRDMLKPSATDIQGWLAKGGAFIGICAGAVLATSDKRRGLRLYPPGFSLCDDNLAAVAGLCGAVEVQFGGSSSSSAAGSRGEDSKVAHGGVLQDGRCCYMHYENGPLMRTTSALAVPLAEYVGTSEEAGLAEESQKQQHRNGENWECGECGAENRKSQKKCACGAKRQQEKRNAKLRAQLEGKMAGKVAVMGITSGSSRAVLFGPHPELSKQHGGWDLLSQAIEWVCPHARAYAAVLQKVGSGGTSSTTKTAKSGRQTKAKSSGGAASSSRRAPSSSSSSDPDSGTSSDSSSSNGS